MVENKYAYSIAVGKPEGDRSLGRPRRRWEENIRMVLTDSMVKWGLDVSGLI
jgi:hypothetical protein